MVADWSPQPPDFGKARLDTKKLTLGLHVTGPGLIGALPDLVKGLSDAQPKGGTDVLIPLFSQIFLWEVLDLPRRLKYHVTSSEQHNLTRGWHRSTVPVNHSKFTGSPKRVWTEVNHRAPNGRPFRAPHTLRTSHF